MAARPEYARGFKGGAKCIPKKDALLLPFQAKWAKDDSRLKLGEKSRQIGWSWTAAYRQVRNKSLKTARYDSWISSRDKEQAKLFIDDCKTFAELLNTAAIDLGEQVIDEKKNSAYILSFANNRRINSLSSEPNAQAGKRGDRVLDEFALHPDPRKLYKIAYPGITWGGTLEIFSTHRGSENLFNQLINEIKHKGNPKGFSFHRVTLQDALDQGLLYKLQCKLSESHECMAMDEAEYFDFIKKGCVDEESFDEEYMCIPSDDITTFLSYDLINTCILRGEDNPKPTTEETIDFARRKGRIRSLVVYDLERIHKMGFPFYVGVDIGRDHDLTVIWVAISMGGMLFPAQVIEMYKVEFSRQEKVLYPILELNNMRRAGIDNTGIGKQFAERAQQKYSRNRIEAVTFNNSIKAEMAFPILTGFQDRSIRVPDDDLIRSDLRAIKKQVVGGNIRFGSDRGKNGHSDRFWALALAHNAATGGPTGPAWAESASSAGINGLEKFAPEVDYAQY